MLYKVKKERLFTNQQLLALLWPLIIEQALGVLVGMADTVMVSSVGEAAISGVSLVDMINQLIYTDSGGLGYRRSCNCGAVYRAPEHKNPVRQRISL